MAGVLASVRDLAEAELALHAGVDVLDLKEPARGALGAWDPDEVAEAVRRFRGRVPLSATAGDLPLREDLLPPVVEALAAAGVDVVKIGLFEGDPAATLPAVAARVSADVRLVAVAFADRGLDPDLPDLLAASGFAGLVVDTADKSSGRLLDHATPEALAGLVARAHARGLFVGLAGSLRAEHVVTLATCGADLFGFRGALCGQGRSGRIEAERVRRVVEAVRRHTGDFPARLRSRLLCPQHRQRHGRGADVHLVS